jgi:hypothetical protein
MSRLSLSELSLSEQIAMELDHAQRLCACTGDVLAVLDPTPTRADSRLLVGAARRGVHLSAMESIA